MSQFDSIVECGSFLDVSGHACDIKPKMVIGIKDGVITLVQALDAKTSLLKQNAKQFIDANDRLVIPGLINGHTHLPMSLFRGLAEDMEFQEWLHGYILPIESQLLDEDFVRVGTELSLWESASYGVTTLNDMYYFSSIVADAMDRSGLRGIVSQTFMDLPTPDNKGNKKLSESILRGAFEQIKNHPRLRLSIAPHAPYTCSDETLKLTTKLASELDLSVHIHVSETAFEVESSRRDHKKTPVQRLWDLGLMERPCVFAHGVHLSHDDISLVAKANVGIIHNPESNMKIAAGVAPIPALLSAGVAVGLGTDGCASNNNLNIIEEMDVAAKLQKLTHSGKGLTAKQVVRMATIEGAKALHMNQSIGSLEVGKRADFAILDLSRPHMQPTHDLVSHLVYSANGSEIDETYCDGVRVFDRNGPTRLNKSQILKEVLAYKNKISQFLASK
jgi:5-methylthioadenosine/S-adenosylhomocysteine deaminase